MLTTEQADRAVKAGAKFIVSPGLNPEIVNGAEHEVPVIPGIVTPTEMAQAIGLGLTMVKFFPAEPAGGLKYYPCHRSTVHHDEIHADRRHQPAECKRILVSTASQHAAEAGW